MKNELPIKYEGGFFSKLKRFLNSVLKKHSVTAQQLGVLKENKVEISTNESDFDKMKAASNRVRIKEDILTLIEKNPALIESLPIDKLKELEKMYDEIIEKNDRKIKQLKREIA